MKTPTERADEAIAAPVDMSDPESVRRARRRCAAEVRFTRDAIAGLASHAPLSSDLTALLLLAVERLERLRVRLVELGASTVA